MPRTIPSTLLTLWLTACVGCGRPALDPTAAVEEVSQPFEEIAPATFEDDDWPGWRGPTSNGHVIGTGPVNWSDSENVVWKVPVPGRGHGSPTVVGQTVYLATADESARTQSVVAFDRSTGEQLWQTTLSEGGFPTDRQVHPTGSHANGTVACDGDRLFIAFLHHDTVTAYALDTAGGVLWERELGPFASRFGYAPSPHVHGSLVIISADHGGGGFLAGLHRESGEVVWKKARPLVTTCSTAVVVPQGGESRLVISGGDMLAAYDPVTGSELWTVPGLSETTCGTCVWDDERIYASGGYPDKQTMAVTHDGKQKWKNRVKCYESSMLLEGDHLYAVDDSGIGYCWEASSGEERWKKRLGGDFSASLVLADGNLYATNESGKTTVFAANPDEFVLIAENQLGESAFATPTICGGRVYHRVATREGGYQEWLYCIE